MLLVNFFNPDPILFLPGNHCTHPSQLWNIFPKCQYKSSLGGISCEYYKLPQPTNSTFHTLIVNLCFSAPGKKIYASCPLSWQRINVSIFLPNDGFGFSYFPDIDIFNALFLVEHREFQPPTPKLPVRRSPARVGFIAP